MTQTEKLVEELFKKPLLYSSREPIFISRKDAIVIAEDLVNRLGVIVPPCKVGDTVYILWPPHQDDAQIIPGEVIGFSVGMKDEVYISNINYCGCFCRPFSEVFVSREVAEQALKEMEDDG